jgi:hypothetical protein
MTMIESKRKSNIFPLDGYDDQLRNYTYEGCTNSRKTRKRMNGFEVCFEENE